MTTIPMTTDAEQTPLYRSKLRTHSQDRKLCKAIVTPMYNYTAVFVDVTTNEGKFRYAVNCNVKHVNFGQITELFLQPNLEYKEIAVRVESAPSKQQLFAALSKVLDATVASRLLPALKI